MVAQYGVQKRGDYYFGQFAYVKAIAEYEKMVEKDFNPAHAHQRLAECYLLIRDFKKALPHFEAIISSTSVSTDYYLSMPWPFTVMVNIKAAEKWLKRYKKYNKNDSRVKRFLKDGNLASVVFNSRQRYDITPATFNSSESDFGVFAEGGHLYFASSRKDQVSGDAYGWNEEPWLDIFTVKEGEPNAVPKK